MNINHHSTEEIKTVTHTLIDKRIWAEHLLSRVRSIMHARGKDRLRELRQLELTIQMEIDDARIAKPLYHFILDHSKELRKKLAAAHPSLSDNDLFLCACIYLGISMADVSKIKAVAPSSVVMSRYRLKKKLCLSMFEDLELYIQNCLKTN